MDVETLSESGEPKRDVDLLIERIQEIQRQLPEHNGVSEEELEFSRAAEEFYESYYSRRRNPMRRH